MKKKLLEAKMNLSLKDARQSLTQDDLKFITGGETSPISGSGSSSSSGQPCCDATCYCKKDTTQD